MTRKSKSRVKRDWLFVATLTPYQESLLTEALILRAIKQLEAQEAKIGQ